jgi:hypothetical protein
MKNKITYSLECSGVMKMEVAGCFVMLVTIYTSVHYHVPEDQSLETDSCQILKFHILVPSHRVCDPISCCPKCSENRLYSNTNTLQLALNNFRAGSWFSHVVLI